MIQQVGLFPHQTIGENIATVPRLLGWPKARTAERTVELLELVGLEAGDAKRYPAQLSGGQRQRVGLARALAADPPVLLMDEPFGAVDPITRIRLQAELRRLHREVGKTIIFVTHDVDEAIQMGDRIAILREGGVLAQYDTPDAILAHPADEFVAQFIGEDRALAPARAADARGRRRWYLLPTRYQVPESCRRSLSATRSPSMLETEEDQLVVVDGDRVLGLFRLNDAGDLL